MTAQTLLFLVDPTDLVDPKDPFSSSWFARLSISRRACAANRDRRGRRLENVRAWANQQLFETDFVDRGDQSANTVFPGLDHRCRRSQRSFFKQLVCPTLDQPPCLCGES